MPSSDFAIAKHKALVRISNGNASRTITTGYKKTLIHWISPRMKRHTILCAGLFLCLGPAADRPFVIEPYLQMGDTPQLSSSDSMVVMWHAPAIDNEWDVQVK